MDVGRSGNGHATEYAISRLLGAHSRRTASSRRGPSTRLNSSAAPRLPSPFTGTRSGPRSPPAPRCAFPRCDQPASVCDIHHIVLRSRGGPTSLPNLVPLCGFHHLTAIHRWGWSLALHNDGTTTATSPDGSRTRHSHSPPGTVHPANPRLAGSLSRGPTRPCSVASGRAKQTRRLRRGHQRRQERFAHHLMMTHEAPRPPPHPRAPPPRARRARPGRSRPPGSGPPARPPRPYAPRRGSQPR